MDRGAWRATIHGIERIRHDLATKSPYHRAGSLLGTVSGARTHWPGWRPHAIRPRGNKVERLVGLDRGRCWMLG